MGSFVECFTVKDVHIPPYYYLGVTGATGSLSGTSHMSLTNAAYPYSYIDYHEVHGLEFSDLSVSSFYFFIRRQ